MMEGEVELVRKRTIKQENDTAIDTILKHSEKIYDNFSKRSGNADLLTKLLASRWEASTPENADQDLEVVGEEGEAALKCNNIVDNEIILFCSVQPSLLMTTLCFVVILFLQDGEGLVAAGDDKEGSAKKAAEVFFRHFWYPMPNTT